MNDTSYVPPEATPTKSSFGTPIQKPSHALTSSQDIRQALHAAQAIQRQRAIENQANSEAAVTQLFQRPTSHGSFNLNYDNQTPVRSIDVGGPDQEQRMADFVTKSIDNLSHGLTVQKALESLGLKDGKDLLPGLEVRLLSHQAIGVAWMVAKEASSDRGGILADDMGLGTLLKGKTVQLIATMVQNQPDFEEEHRTTLIVVPAALLLQWKEEIESKTNGAFTVHIHHGKDKIKKLSQVRKYDVIVTTYQTLNQDFFIPKDIDTADEVDWLAGNGGLLARAKFYRAVADEAQFIRNRADIYGLLRFGRFRPWNDWLAFDEHVAKVQYEDAPLAGSRAQAILKPILLRRTKDSFLEGKPILDLPPKSIEIVNLEFSKEERDVYDSFEKQTKIKLNKFIRERTLVKNHAFVLVMILRLRQLCCHPNLILSKTAEGEDPTLLIGGDSEKELARARKVMGSAWVAEVKKRALVRRRALEVLDFADEDDEGEPCCAVCQEFFINDNGRVLSCSHEICFDCQINLQNAPIVHDGIFGEGNEKQNFEAEKEFEAGAAKGFRPCKSSSPSSSPPICPNNLVNATGPTCKKMVDLTPNKVFKASAFEPTDEELTKEAETRRASGSRKLCCRDVDMKSLSSSPAKSFEDRALDDSDDDLPDVSTMLDERPSKRPKKSNVIDSDDDDEMSGLTLELAGKIVKMGTTSDSEIEIIDTPSKKKSSPTKAKGKNKTPTKKRLRDEQEGPSEEVIATWRRGDDDLEPSTKMLALLDLLQQWEATGDKTIVYSQWTSMLDLLDVLFSRHGIQSLRFDGKMDRAARDHVLSTFKRPGGPKVIMISTKCGSVGLNLVSANRIVNMDLSWNYAAESQAYDRVHRIGQDKDVVIKRLVVDNTIEERLLKLQDVKTGLAEAALGEGSGVKLHKLSVKDIKYLFGMTPTAKPAGGNGRAETPGSSQD
ncbi:hypothetical protein H0H93_016927 [Arthromyces matolae]|nr:hypothetical protein H0H93_016927 [Arthromyces matolae]